MKCIMPKVDGVKIHGSSRRYGTCVYLHAIVITLIELYSSSSSLKQMVSLFCIDNTFLHFFRFINSHPVQTFMICLLCLDVLILFIELRELYIHYFSAKKNMYLKHMISFFYLCQLSYIIHEFIDYRAQSAGDVFSIVCQSHTQVSSGDRRENKYYFWILVHIIIIYSLSL